jgi:hypothetical protein
MSMNLILRMICLFTLLGATYCAGAWTVLELTKSDPR